MWLSWGVGLALAVPSVDAPLHTGAQAPDDAAVVIGLEDYVFLPDVPHAANDARAVVDFLVSSRGVPSDRVQRLDSAGREQILAAVEQASTATGTVWVYFAGHGVAAPSDGRRLVLGDDARQDPAAFEARGVALDELADLAGAGGGKVVMWVDACFNGASRGGEAMAPGTRFAIPDYVSEARDGVLNWAAAGPDQLARPLDAAEHGAFTYLSLGALRGWADGAIDGSSDGQVTAAEAQVFASRGLRDLGISDQEPVLRGAGDWVLAAGSLEPAPDLDADDFVTAPGPGQQVVMMPGFEPELLATAAAYDVVLPLTRHPFGYRDANGDKVRRDTFMKLVRSTKKGRRGMRNVGIGAALTTVGWAGAMGLGMATAVTQDTTLLWPTAGSLVLGISGMGLLVGGDQAARSSVEPDFR